MSCIWRTLIKTLSIRIIQFSFGRFRIGSNIFLYFHKAIGSTLNNNKLWLTDDINGNALFPNCYVEYDQEKSRIIANYYSI